MNAFMRFFRTQLNSKRPTSVMHMFTIESPPHTCACQTNIDIRVLNSEYLERKQFKKKFFRLKQSYLI